MNGQAALPADLSAFVVEEENDEKTVTLAVEGIHCAVCIGKIENELRQVPGVIGARVNYTNRRVVVRWHGGKLNPNELLSRLTKIGYRAYPFRLQADGAEAQYASWLLRCLAVAGFAAMNVMLLSVSVWSGNVTDITPETRDFFHWLSALIVLPAIAYCGRPFFDSAFRALRSGGVNMDVPISLGVLLAIGLSLYETATHGHHAYFDSAIMLMFFLLTGRYLEQAAQMKMRTAAGNISALRGDVACRIENGKAAVVPVERLKTGDLVMVRAGERVPADGLVTSGAGLIDESLVTGETAGRSVAKGDIVYGGSLNLDSVLYVEVTAASEKSLLADIERLIAAAGENKTKYVRLADSAARLYAPVVHVTAALTLAGWLVAGAGIHQSIVIAIAVLIITCPCALALAVPTVQVVAMGELFRSNIIVNSPELLERLSEADAVVFDKTGTLTLPDAAVGDFSHADPELADIAARLALASSHPLARALAKHSTAQLSYPDAKEKAGEGVAAMVNGREARLGSAVFCNMEPQETDERNHGKSAIYFRYSDRTAAFWVGQQLRKDAVEIVRALRERGLEVTIASGDREEAVAEIATQLGIETFRFACKPQEKYRLLEEMKQAGRKVLMVGDGVNDAPALAAAHVSLSPITAAQITQAHADGMFLGERLRPVLDAVEIARRARRIMHQNLWLAVIYNVVAVPLAVAGFVTPLIAAAAMSGSSVLVTLNSLRAKRSGKREGENAMEASGAPAEVAA